MDPANSGQFVLIPVLVDYHVSGTGSYSGTPVIIVKARFALRFEAGRGTPSGDLRAASGSHDLDIYLDSRSGALVFIRDRFDETFTFASGSTERHAGFTLVFCSSSLRGERAAVLADLGVPPSASAVAPNPSAGLGTAGDGGGGQGRPLNPGPPAGQGAVAAGASPPGAGAGDFQTGGMDELEEGPELIAAGVDLLESPAGIVFRIKDLQFVADSDELLPAAKARLDEVAAILLRFPGRNFLVEGHAAGVGKPAGELALSELRALRVVKELAARGIPASRFTWRGLGSSQPLVPNDTEAGRSLNRRVEITLLE